MTASRTARAAALGRRRELTQARRMGIIALLLVIAAVLAAALFRITNANGRHAYDGANSPLSTYQLTEGKTYQISTRGGVSGLLAHGVDVSTANCSWSSDDATSQPLSVVPADSGTRLLHQVATFVAPTSGPVQITCAQWGALFIDDADNSTFDLPGFFVLATVLLLATAAIVGIGALYRRPSFGTRYTDDEDDEPELALLEDE